MLTAQNLSLEKSLPVVVAFFVPSHYLKVSIPQDTCWPSTKSVWDCSDGKRAQKHASHGKRVKDSSEREVATHKSKSGGKRWLDDTLVEHQLIWATRFIVSSCLCGHQVWPLPQFCVTQEGPFHGSQEIDLFQKKCYAKEHVNGHTWDELDPMIEVKSSQLRLLVGWALDWIWEIRRLHLCWLTSKLLIALSTKSE